MLKHDQTCNASSSPTRRKRALAKCVKPLFVTGCGGSGTHFVSAAVRDAVETLSKVWSFLSNMRVLGEVTHEQPCVLPFGRSFLTYCFVVAANRHRS